MPVRVMPLKNKFVPPALKSLFVERRYERRDFWANCAAAGFLVLASISAAEDNRPALEEVIVTAERRESNLQEVPIAVTSLSQADLEAKHISDIGDLQALVPNLSIHVGDANNAVVYIRGIGQIDSIAFFEPGVGIYLDDVYLGRAQGAFLDVVDVERIEVLRGPQGSLYGRNTIGGAIKYVSAAPTEELSGKVSVSLGNYNRRDIKATLAGPIAGDMLSGRLTVAHLEREGYASNAFDGKGDGDREMDFVRGVLNFDFSEAFNLQLSADYSDSTPERSRTPAKETAINVTVVDPYTFGVSVQTFAADDDPFRVNVDFNTTEFTETQGLSANATWELNDTVTLKSITSLRELDYGTEIDLDGTPISAFSIFYFNQQEQKSQELQLNITTDHWSLVSGLYYFKEEGETFDGGIFANLLIAGAGEAEFTTTSYAVFSQLDFDFSDSFSGIVGLRYTEEEKQYSRIIEDFDLTALAGIGFDGDGAVTYANPNLLTPNADDLQLGGGIGVARPAANPEPANFYNFSPKLGLKYQLSDNGNIYATYSTSFKSGGFNGRLADGQLNPYDEETLSSFELGLKTMLFDDRLRTNLAIFHNRYKDLQVSSFEATQDGSSLLPVFTNAGEAKMQGIELEITALLSEQLTLNSNVGFLDAKYTEYFAGSDTDSNTSVDVSDEREMVNAPKVDAFIGLVYSVELSDLGNLDISSDLSYRSKTYLEVNSSEILAQSAYTLWNAALSFESSDEAWRVSFAVKNITDEEYRTHAFDLSAFPGVELAYYNPPRTYSANITYRF